MIKPSHFLSFIVVMAIGLILFMGYRWFYHFPQQPPIYRPDFTLTDLQGQDHIISEWDNQVIIVNFWATWCPPCIREIPVLIKLQNKYQDQGLQILGIAIDEPNKVKEFVHRKGIQYPILGGEQAITTARNFGNTYGGLPYTVVINRSGYIVYKQVGEINQTNMEQIIKTWINLTATTSSPKELKEQK